MGISIILNISLQGASDNCPVLGGNNLALIWIGYNAFMSWNLNYDREIHRAQQARAEGNEGMARVCARRAAGEVIREYFQRAQIPFTKPAALDVLKTLSQTEQVSLHVREVAGHFLWRITHDHALPEDVDLLVEVQWLAKELLDQEKR